jgi:hypothetical protein
MDRPAMTKNEEKNWFWVLQRNDGGRWLFWDKDGGETGDYQYAKQFDTREEAEAFLATLPKMPVWKIQPGNLK